MTLTTLLQNIFRLVVGWKKIFSITKEMSVSLQHFPVSLEKIFDIIVSHTFRVITLSCWFFFSIWVFFHEHSRITGLQGKGEGISLSPLYHFHPLHRHVGISGAITAGSSPLRIACSRTGTRNLWFLSASR